MPQSPQFNADHSPLTAPLVHFRRTDLALAGGKGANLGELLRAGFAVPPGFVITTAAYDLLLRSDGLDRRLQDMLASLRTEEPASVKQVSQGIRTALQRAPMPSQVADEILTARRGLAESPVAVRSSATAEDLPEAAFAGQQETFLNVIGEAALLEAVRACWISLWSERAILYRARQNVDQVSVKLAVVVQRMVPAETAGVMFTADPVSGARRELVIDANPGLGEAVVAGLVTPDHFVVDKRSLRVKEQRPGRREVVIRAKAQGGTEQITPGQSETAAPALPPPGIRQLAKLGIRIEKHFGAPQDIEWAWVNNGGGAGQFFILQARPMTALPEPLKVSAAMQRVIPMLAEMWPARPYPLDVTTFSRALERAVGNFMAAMIGKSAPDPDRLFLEEDGVVVRFEPPEVRPSPAVLIMPWLALWRTRGYNPSLWQRDPILAEVVTHARGLEQRDLRSLTWEQNIETLHEALALIPRAMQLRERYFPQALVGLGGLWLLLLLAGRKNHFGALVGGVETKTTETNRALETLAAEIRATPALADVFARAGARELLSVLKQSKAGGDFLERFHVFLAEYGHRETALTISQGAWKDQPETVLGILKVLSGAQPQEAASYEAWKQARDELLAHSILGSRLLRNLFLRALGHARSFFQMREDTHFYATLVLPTVRHIALELGRRLVQAAALDTAEDVFHLRLEELDPLGKPWPPSAETLARMRELAARRKAKRESLADQPLFDPRLLAVVSTARPGEQVLLSGSPGSPGVASGPARIVRDGSEFGRLKPGDVLVAPVTNPAWTPLFQRAAAVVVDTGGLASHAAIVAREYGIPAVMGTLHGTRQLTDGQWIQVDGSHGLVLKAEEPK